MRKPFRAVGILIKQKQILLIHRIKKDREYFVFPGGGLEEGETVREATIREIKEEASIEASIEKLFYLHDYGSSKQLFYLCKYIKGRPRLTDDSNEKKKMEETDDDFYEPVWTGLEKLSQMLVYPLEIRDWLIEDLKGGFPQKPRLARIKAEELRQSL